MKNQTTATATPEAMLQAVIDLLRLHGYTVENYGKTLSLADKFPYGVMNPKAKIILVNDATPTGEQIFTLFHELGHIFSRAMHDEDQADRIAIFMCQLVEKLTGARIEAEPMEGKHIVSSDLRFDYGLLKARIKEKFSTQANFAMAAGISPNRISRLLNNKAEWTAPEIEKAVAVLELSADDIPQFFFTQK